MAGQRLQVQLLGPQHRLDRLWRHGTAFHHAGADLVPRAAVPVDLVAVPVRPVHLPVLDLHHRHRVPVRARVVLRLDVPVWLAAGGHLQDRACGGLQALSDAAAAEVARPAQVGQVRGVLRVAGGFDVLDGTG
ncbi:hypothetical protein D3C72_2017870 [compost metagenome]